MAPNDHSIRSIQAAVAQELGLRGVNGALHADAAELRLTGSGQGSVELGTLPANWAALDANQQRRRARQLAQQLFPSGSHDGQRPRLSRSSLLASLGLLVLSLALGASLVSQMRDHQSAATQTPAEEPIESRESRTRRVCQATQSRVMRGGTPGPVDREGWVLELQLILPPDSPPVSKIPPVDTPLRFRDGDLQKAQLHWPALMVNDSGSATRLTVVDLVLPDRREVRLEMTGDYVRSYFSSETRIHWHRLAQRLASWSNATHGGLFARCEHLTARHVGTWFLGPNPGGSLAALLYFIGSASQTPVLHPDLLAERQGGDAAALSLFSELERRTAKVNKRQLGRWVAKDEGTVTSGGTGYTTLQFPYRDANRAARSSRRLAKQLVMDPTAALKPLRP